MAAVGDRLKEIREARGWTQDRLAERSGVSKGFLSEIENGKRNPSSEYVLRIANALGASLDYLLRGDETTPNVPKAPVVIPHALATAAEQLNLSYAQTVELLEAHRSIVARRSSGQIKAFEARDWVDFYRAIKKVFG